MKISVRMELLERVGMVLWMPGMVRNKVLMRWVKGEQSLLCLMSNLSLYKLLQVSIMLNAAMLVQRGLQKTRKNEKTKVLSPVSYLLGSI